MTLIRLLIFCLAILATVAQPSRAAPACPMGAHRAEAAQPATDGGTTRHHHGCPDRTACCAPLAVRVAIPAPVVPQVWRPAASVRPTTERVREDAARDSLLRPPTSA